ncbi:sigma-70 family RNA polymerase sigma factor [Novipirellula rosea]|uniref:Sigma-70 family RNA polymerase sigma factor n=1 Tax=Novipirellula rosea TaxID=1031540 RepID=A0ABP8MSK2_9BACT
MIEEDFWAERHRDYLRLLGLAQLSPGAQAKIDLSGVIQTTMLEAHHNEKLATNAVEHQLPWLRRVFLNNLLDALRKRRAKRRDMRRERSLEDPIEQSASRLEMYLQVAESSPCTKAIQQERAELLLQAIAGLPDDQRTAIELHHLQELPLEQIAATMDRPKGAVAALIYRGMKKLRATIDESCD